MLQVGLIETQYRTYPLEVLAGEPDLNVTVKESNALFKFDYAKVRGDRP
jgi:tRNA (guanine37-N1)-methyltransferase